VTTARIETFHLADLGEGLTEAFVQETLVKVGDVVELFSPVAVIETEKATVEITSPFAGTVKRVCVTENNYVNVGDAVIEVEVTDD
jgi:pyruvate/2-oxoglutarate dehydrogenase complex dihydrolipoamide acyltransferase (E2) component